MISWVSKFTWEIPQTVIGFFVFLVCKILKRKTFIYKNSILTETKKTGVSLGAFIFCVSVESYSSFGHDDPLREAADCRNHEHGHTIQSKMLGPLYLLIVGLPSLTMNILTTLKVLKSENYYKRFPENWADKLGKVERKSII